MRKRIFIFMLFILAFDLTAQIQEEISEDKPQKSPITFSQPRHLFAVFNHKSVESSLSQLDVYWQFVNDILLFVKTDDEKYLAKYELNIDLLDDNKNIIDSFSKTEEILTSKFEEANSNLAVNAGKATMLAKPGNYTLRIELRDRDSGNFLLRDRKIELKDFSGKKTTLSDVLLVDALDVEKSETEYQINLSGHFSDSTSFCGAYFEIYPENSKEKIEVEKRIIDSNGKAVFSENTEYATDRPVIKEWIQFKNKVRYLGRYLLEINVKGLKELSVKKYFFMNWNNTPFEIPSIDQVAEMLDDLGNADELKEISKAEPEEKEKIWDAFWKKRDPSPGTPENELREEFFKRLEFTFRHFTVHSKDKVGWKTDRGKVYLRYGEPTWVRRYVTDLRRPALEVWYYESVLNKFMFYDREGEGEYKLKEVQ